MGWSTIEWPPKNGTNIKPTSKLQKKIKKLLVICVTLIILFAGIMGWAVLAQNNHLSFGIVKEKIEFVQENINNYYQSLLVNLLKDDKKDMQ